MSTNKCTICRKEVPFDNTYHDKNWHLYCEKHAPPAAKEARAKRRTDDQAFTRRQWQDAWANNRVD